MNTFEQLIEGIALAKIINASVTKQPIYTSFHNLRKEQKEKLIAALIANNSAVQEMIANKIDSALENKIDALLNDKNTNAQEEQRQMIADDNRARAQDMRLSI